MWGSCPNTKSASAPARRSYFQFEKGGNPSHRLRVEMEYLPGQFIDQFRNPLVFIALETTGKQHWEQYQANGSSRSHECMLLSAWNLIGGRRNTGPDFKSRKASTNSYTTGRG
ncbi:hypothetical protein Droror1_Dr00003378 [Drosera rotundifolia]